MLSCNDSSAEDLFSCFNWDAITELIPTSDLRVGDVLPNTEDGPEMLGYIGPTSYDPGTNWLDVYANSIGGVDRGTTWIIKRSLLDPSLPEQAAQAFLRTKLK